jgi:gluconokinase
MAVAGVVARVGQAVSCGRENAILACSALKKAYRRHLRVNSEVTLVYLRGNFTLIADQLRHRRGHFMNPALLRSQFADLEEPQPAEGVLAIELGPTPQELVEEIKTNLHLTSKE